jgi:hypothetical protein
MYGSGFAVAVFDRILGDEFSPNVSFEAGCCYALGKPVCLLKDQTLKALPGDLLGMLFEGFDPRYPRRTIPRALKKWLRDAGLVEHDAHQITPSQSSLSAL